MVGVVVININITISHNISINNSIILINHNMDVSIHININNKY